MMNKHVRALARPLSCCALPRVNASSSAECSYAVGVSDLRPDARTRQAQGEGPSARSPIHTVQARARKMEHTNSQLYALA